TSEGGGVGKGSQRIAKRGRWGPCRLNYSLLAVRHSRARSAPGLLPILLNARGAQAGQAMAIDGVLPGEEFFDGQRITAAGFLQRKQAAAHRSHDLSFAADDPALRPR